MKPKKPTVEETKVNETPVVEDKPQESHVKFHKRMLRVPPHPAEVWSAAVSATAMTQNCDKAIEAADKILSAYIQRFNPKKETYEDIVQNSMGEMK